MEATKEIIIDIQAEPSPADAAFYSQLMMEVNSIPITAQSIPEYRSSYCDIIAPSPQTMHFPQTSQLQLFRSTSPGTIRSRSPVHSPANFQYSQHLNSPIEHQSSPVMFDNSTFFNQLPFANSMNNFRSTSPILSPLLTNFDEVTINSPAFENQSSPYYQQRFSNGSFTDFPTFLGEFSSKRVSVDYNNSAPSMTISPPPTPYNCSGDLSPNNIGCIAPSTLLSDSSSMLVTSEFLPNFKRFSSPMPTIPSNMFRNDFATTQLLPPKRRQPKIKQKTVDPSTSPPWPIESNRKLSKIKAEPALKRFTCHICGVGVSKMSNLRSHMLTHSGFQGFHCKICTSKFARKHDSFRHIRNIHKISKDDGDYSEFIEVTPEPDDEKYMIVGRKRK